MWGAPALGANFDLGTKRQWQNANDKTPMTKRQHPKPQYEKCSPQPQNPNPQTQKSVGISYTGVLSVALWLDTANFLLINK